MDDLALIVKGIDVKIRKLVLFNKQLREKILSLEIEKRGLLEELASANSRINELETELTHLQSVKLMDGMDSSRAKQKVNELLREIEKVHVLLNR